MDQYWPVSHFFICVCRIAKVLEVELYVLTYLFVYFIFEISTAVLTRLHFMRRLILTLWILLVWFLVTTEIVLCNETCNKVAKLWFIKSWSLRGCIMDSPIILSNTTYYIYVTNSVRGGRVRHKWRLLQEIVSLKDVSDYGRPDFELGLLRTCRVSDDLHIKLIVGFRSFRTWDKFVYIWMGLGIIKYSLWCTSLIRYTVVFYKITNYYVISVDTAVLDF